MIKDISLIHIEEFLKLNHIDNYSHNTAIQLINSDVDYTLTKPIENWLIAFEFKDVQPNLELSYYYDLFQVTDQQDVMDILTYLQKTTFNQLPEDIITEILCHLEDMKAIRSVSVTINNYCKKIISNGWFRKRKCELMLLKKGYTIDHLFNIDYIYRALVPQAGYVVYVNENKQQFINFYEPIVKIVIIKHVKTILVLTQSGKLFVKSIDDMTFSVTDLTILIDDILLYNNKYYYLSGGKIYYGPFNIINRFSYEGRAQQHDESKLKRLTSDHVEFDNILSMCGCDDGLIFLKSNGQVYNEYGHFIVDHVLQIASNKKHYAILLNNHELYNSQIKNIDKLVSGDYSYLCLGKNNYYIDKKGSIEPLPMDIKTGIYGRFQGVLLSKTVEIYTDKIDFLPICAVNIFKGHDVDYYLLKNDNHYI